MTEIQKVFWSRIGHSVNIFFFRITFTHQHCITNVIFDPWRVGTCGKHACISVWLYCRHCITHTCKMQSQRHDLDPSRSSKESYEYAEANCWATPMLLRERQNLAIIPCVFFPCGLLEKKKALVQLSGHFRSNAFICITVWCIVTDYAVACKDGRKR